MHAIIYLIVMYVTCVMSVTAIKKLLVLT